MFVCNIALRELEELQLRLLFDAVLAGSLVELLFVFVISLCERWVEIRDPMMDLGETLHRTV